MEIGKVAEWVAELNINEGAISESATHTALVMKIEKIFSVNAAEKTYWEHMETKQLQNGASFYTLLGVSEGYRQIMEASV